MSRVAVVKDGVVVNVIEAGPDFRLPGFTLVASDVAGVGWLYDGKAFKAPTPAPPPSVETPPITYKADVWRRATEAQAAVIDTELQKLDVRRRRMWDDSMYLDHSDELVAFFRTMLTQTFGATEANRILAPSNV